MNDDAALRSIQSRLKTAGFYAGPVDGDWGPGSDAAFDLALSRAVGAALATPPQAEVRTLGPADFARAAAALACSVPQIRTVVSVESGGGWFTDLRADILALDGPGGFLAGERLPKILFEAHKFAQHTGGRFNRSHPNISAPRWNRALYVGGQGEYRRLHVAMELDRDAALKSASWGMFQILGENHRLAGFADVEGFVAAMKASEAAHLDAFVAFVRSAGLTDELRRIGPDPDDCLPFALGYNGSGARANKYPEKLAADFRRFSA